jgi:hypothetical protein
MGPNRLRIIVFPETPRTWIARGLEHDLAAGGRTIEAAIDTFMKIALAHIAYDERHHHQPLAAFAAAPRPYWEAFATATPLPVPMQINWLDDGTVPEVLAAVVLQDPAIVRRARKLAHSA